MLFSAICCLSGNEVFAKEILNFGENNQVQILSDKAYRKSNDNSYEAQGNVIIKLGNNSIYGEKASFSLLKQRSQVWGNVRYVGEDYTLYATELDYNLANQEITVKNAKLVDENFVILGKEIRKDKSGIIYAKEAEYTTCRDCPESWTILGKDVKVIPNQYVYLKHSFIKIKGVVVLYIPYLILPIKKDRESGVLFPKFGFDLERGFYFKQPYFQVLSNSADFTISPSNFGQRAIGSEFEFRKAINSDSEYTFFNMSAFDRIWRSQKTSTELESNRIFRQFTDSNLFYRPSNHFNLYSNIKYLSDLDIQSDYAPYFENKLLANEYGSEAGAQFNYNFINVDFQSSFKNNSFFQNAKGFDHSYVQELANLDISHLPFAILENLGVINRVSFEQNVNFKYLKQNHEDFNSSTIRNVTRIDYTPKLSLVTTFWDTLNFKSEVSFDYQLYHLPSQYQERTAAKSGQLYKNIIAFDFEKSFGQAYIETITVPKVLEVQTQSDLISKIPNLNAKTQQKKILHSSYKHLLSYEFAHSLYKSQKTSGNLNLFTQFERDDSSARFDERDILRGNDNVLFDSSTRTDLPESNTFEFSINNALLKKTPKENFNPFDSFKYNQNNFQTSKIFYFDVSQGILLGDTYDDFSDRLTRLATTFGFTLGDMTFSGSEYFFHEKNKNITNLSISHKLSFIKYNVDYIYDSFSVQRRNFEGDFYFNFNDSLELRTGTKYNLETKRIYESYVGGLYRPNNNCWQFDLEYKLKDRLDTNNEIYQDKVISFNFLLNYSTKGFNSFLGLTL